MKKCIAFSLIVLLFICPAVFASETTAPDFEPKSIDGFRGYKWGASYDDVLKSTPNSQGDGGEMILEYDYNKLDLDHTNHEVKIAGYPMTAVYRFSDGLLTSGLYMVDIEAEKLGGYYYQEYVDLVEAYKKVYGSPRVSIEGWKDENDFMKDMPDYYDAAIATERVTFCTVWGDKNESSTSDIIIMLSGHDNLLKFAITYEKESSLVNSKEETTADYSGI